MRKHPKRILSCLAGALLALIAWGTPAAFAGTTITLDQPVHFTTAEGSDVVLDAGAYDVAAADEWLRVTPSEGQAVDAVLLEAQVDRHEEALKAPLGLSAQGESSDTHHLALLLPNGERLEAVGSYSGIRSRGFSLLTIQRLRTLSSTTNTEFSTPRFGGSGGTGSYNLDCGSGSVMVGGIYKAGMWLDAIGVICQRVNAQTGALEGEFTRGPVGGSGGVARTNRCRQGRVVQGVLGYSGQFVHGVDLRCSPWDASKKAPIFSVSGRCIEDRCTLLGINRGSRSDSFYCPSGKVGKAFRGRKGIYIDSLRFVCDFWNK